MSFYTVCSDFLKYVSVRILQYNKDRKTEKNKKKKKYRK